MKKAPRDLNCKCGALHNRHSSCLCSIRGWEVAWGRCPSDYNLLQFCVSSLSSAFDGGALIVKEKKGGETVMDLWHTGWDRLRKGGAAGFTFQGTVGFVFSFDLRSYQLFLSAAISEEITEMESQHEALYGRNRARSGSLNLLNYAIHCSTQPLPSLFSTSTNLEASSGWVSVLSVNLLPAYHPLKSNGSE